MDPLMAAKSAVPETVKGRDLPSVLANKFAVKPDEDVRVLLLRPREEANRRVGELMEELGAEAEDKGLTEPGLRAMLDAG